MIAGNNNLREVVHGCQADAQLYSLLRPSNAQGSCSATVRITRCMSRNGSLVGFSYLLKQAVGANKVGLGRLD